MGRKWEKESQGKRDIWIAAPPDPSLPHRYLHLPPVITLMATNMPPPTLNPTLTWLPLLTSFLERFRILTVGAICIMSDRPSSWYSLLLLKFKDNSFGARRGRVKVTI